MIAERPRSRLGSVLASVRFRVTVLATLAVVSVLVATAVGLAIAQHRQLTEGIEDALRQRASDLDALILANDQVPFALGATGDDTVTQVVTPDGVVLAASANLTGDDRPIASPPPPSGPVDVLRTVDDLPVDDDSFRVLSRRIDTTEGPVIVHVARSLDDVGDSVEALATSLTVAVPAVTALLAALIWWFVGRALRPVEAIRAEVADITGSDLHRRVPEPARDDEIARLARTMNGMLDRVEVAAEHQRRFVADASHELRGPLTRIRSEIEVDLAHPDGADPTATHRSVLEEAAGLTRLVDDLLHLARSDAGAATVARGLVDLDDIVLRQAGRARSRDGVAPDGTGVTAVQVVGDADQLERAVGNLVDNAVRHAGSRVAIALGEVDGRAVLSVTDDGPGIPLAEQERVFERFARLDDARSGAEGGTGLGLAIARDVARRHGGDVVVDPTHAPGARLVMTIPTTPTGSVDV